MPRLALVAVLALALAAAAVEPARSADRTEALAVFGGLGSWLDVYAGRPWSQPRALVAAAKARGVVTLYLQTSNYRRRDDVVDPAALGRFVDAAHAAGLRVVAWYLPGFARQERDARRALAAVRFRSATGQRFDAFALDIEASVVANVAVRNARLLALARLLRRSVPVTYPLGAIIPSPVGMRRHPRYWPGFPYAELARSFDAFLPMAYFSYYVHTPEGAYAYAREVVAELRARSGQPDPLIHMIGGSSKSIPGATLAGFVRAVSDCGAHGVSLYAFPQTSEDDWAALADAALGGPAVAGCG